MIPLPFRTGLATVITDDFTGFTQTVEVSDDGRQIVVDYGDTGYVIGVSRLDPTSKIYTAAEAQSDEDQEVFEISGVDSNGQKFLVRDVRSEDAIWVLGLPFAVPVEALRRVASTEVPSAQIAVDAVTTQESPNGAVHTMLLTCGDETFGRHRHEWHPVPSLANLDPLVLTACPPRAVEVFDRAQDYYRLPSLEDLPKDTDQFMYELRALGMLA